MMPSTEFPFSVNDPVRGHIVHVVAVVQRPADHSCGAERQKIGDGAIVGHAAAGYLAHYCVHQVVVAWLFFHGLVIGDWGFVTGDLGLVTGDLGLGIGDWGLGNITSLQLPVPNP